VKSQKPDWIRDRKLNLLAQLGPNENAELTGLGVPPIWRYMRNDEARKVHEMVVGQQAFTRPLFHVDERAARDHRHAARGFRRHHARPAISRRRREMRIDISPLPGARVQELVAKLYATPPEIVERARAAIRP